MMDNYQVAEHLSEISLLLEASQEKFFKVNAYKKAARSVRGQSEFVGRLLEVGSDQLKSVEGVGRSIAQVIAQFITEGDSTVYRELSEKVPSGLLSLLDVPGLGVKKATLVYESFEPKDLKELLSLIEGGELATLKGFASKTLEKLKKSVEHQLENEGFVTLGRADFLLGYLGDLLARESGFEAEVLGADRGIVSESEETFALALTGEGGRRCEKIKELSFLLTCVEGEKALEKLGFVSEGESRFRGRLLGDEMVVVVVPRELWGSWYLWLSCDERCRVFWQEKARAKGLSWEPGSFVVGGGPKEFFAELSIQERPVTQWEGDWIADWNEREVFCFASLPVCGNLHTHSLWSDGVDRLEDLKEYAECLGYSYLAVTDHSESLKIASGLTPQRLREQHQEIDALNQGGEGCLLLKGCECDILADGSLDYEDLLLASCDIVVAAIHQGLDKSSSEQTQRVVSALRNPNVHILAHPHGSILQGRSGYQLEWSEILPLVRGQRKALEINCAPQRLDLDSAFLKRLRDEDVWISLGTDAHSQRGFSWLSYGLDILERANFPRERVLNFLSLPELLSWLKREA